MKAMRAELRKISKRLDSIETRLAADPQPGKRSKKASKPKSKKSKASPKKSQSK